MLPALILTSSPAWVDTAVAHLPELALVFAVRATVMLLEVGKTVSIAQGRRSAASVLAFLDTIAWLSLMATLLANPTIPRIIAYALGVAVGTWTGLWLLNAKLRLGLVTVRAFVTEPDGTQTGELAAAAVRDRGFGATCFTGNGRTGQVTMVLTTVKRRCAQQVIDAVRQVAPDTFVSIDGYPGPGSRISGVDGPHRV